MPLPPPLLLCVVVSAVLLLLLLLLLYYYYILLYTGKNPTYTQAIIKVFAHNTVYRLKASFLLFCAVQVKWKNKEYHHGGFQQQSPQCLIDGYEHMDNRNDHLGLRLKLMLVA